MKLRCNRQKQFYFDKHFFKKKDIKFANYKAKDAIL